MESKFQPPIRTGLLDFFGNSSGCQFVIPVYQRNYTWRDNKEVKQLLDDLQRVLSGEYRNHFLGIMIYLDTPIDFSARELSVIDGQQRLTTTFLALYAIRELLSENNMKEEIQRLDGQYLTNPFSSNKIKYKLKPLVSDDEVYKKIVLNKLDEIKNTNSNVYKNYIYILKYLRKLLEKEIYSINDLLMAFNKLYIVCIPLSTEDNAQKIFESINSTGVKLTASDLIRNYILMDMKSDQQEKYYKEYWKELERLLSSDAKKLESFFRFYLAAKTKNLPNKNAVYKLFVSWFNDNIEEYGVEGIFQEIIKYAKYHHVIYKKKINHIEPSIRKPIKEFRRISSEMPAPLLMEILNLYNKDLINSEQLSEVITIINTYLIRRALCDLDTSSITRLFPTLLKDILEDCKEDYNDIIEVLKKNLINKNIGNAMYMPDDIELEDLIKNANMYSIRSTLRVFFDKLEHHNNPAPVDLNSLNVEHIMPQTPTKKWLEELDIDEETYQRNLHRLGNLTLVSRKDNSIMQNKVWKYKNKILENTSHLKINEELLKVDKWTIKSIDERTNGLIENIKELYPYVMASDTIIPKIAIYINHNDIKASGYLYLDNGSVEIEAGSELYEHENKENFPEIEEHRQELSDEKIIGENEKGLIFIKPYIFHSKVANATALSSSASLILHGSRNGWVYWEDEFGNSLNMVDSIKEEFER
ncbi:GmrSD restriction endonuclease domain-containing protein [Senegalia sp. (in: firmicutes)]|uniref:GmrSD restriction endonuclease domain-containing protein n=1 Tax=Senegalia sp. (in: firmicutes) TaxID=1924098 RepID=UPI003F9B73E4